MIVTGSDANARFERIYKAHYAQLLSYGLRRGLSEADAHDAVEEVYALVFEKMDDAPAADDEVLPWLYAFMWRIRANFARTNFRRGELVRRLMEIQRLYGFEVAEPDEQTEEFLAMFRSLGSLRPADREILLLSGWERLSIREIAVVQGCSENAATLRLRRARERLTAVCEKENVQVGHKEDERPDLRSSAESDD